MSELFHGPSASMNDLSTGAAGSPATPAEEQLQAKRSFDRAEDGLRPITLTRDVVKGALGSCYAEFGDTKVLCCATIEETLPGWRKSAHAGWVTAEYAMLPAAGNRRSKRETSQRKGRSMEIERLIGRSLRTVVNLQALGEITVTLDCDVIQADGGTRTASVTGAWVALHDCLMAWVNAGKIARLPLRGQVAAVSAGMVDGRILLDLDYREDSNAEIDLNLVGTETGELIEIQGTGERTPFNREKLDQMLDYGQAGIAQLIALQNKITNFQE